MQLYQTDDEGVFVGVVMADLSPLETGVWLIPAGCVETAPPGLTDHQVARWVDGSWQIEDLPPEPEPEGLPPTIDEQRAAMRLTFAQLLIGLVTEAWITQAEGEAWLAGTLPLAVTTLIATLPTNEQFIAKAHALRPSEVLRLDSLVVSMGAAQGKTPEEIDTFFQTYQSV